MDYIDELYENTRQEDDCLIWLGGCHTQGYPMQRFQGKMVLVARLLKAWQMGEDLDSNRRVKRTCQNKKCVNPDHYFVAEPNTEEHKCFRFKYPEETRKAIRKDWLANPVWGQKEQLCQKYKIARLTLDRILAEKNT